MGLKPMLPKTKDKLDADFKDCLKRKRFVEVDKNSYREYIERAKKDFISGARDLEAGDLYWCVIKLDKLTEILE